MIKDTPKIQVTKATKAGHAFADFLFAINPDDMTDMIAINLNKAVCAINDAQDRFYPRTATDRPTPIIPENAASLQKTALAAAQDYATALQKIDTATYTHDLSDHIEQVQYRIGHAMKHAFGGLVKTKGSRITSNNV